MPYKLTKSELSYYAGFFDGEGCIMIKKKHRGRPFHTLDITISSTNHNILEDFKRAFGGTVHGAYKSNTYYKDKWNWMVGGDKALAVLKALYPYLRLKSREAELGIEFQERAKYQRSDALRAGQEAIKEAQYILMKGLKK
ncbi:hypothetical protein LCGC14_2001540 [marine sediment metagenome]|uniref:Homing endonuclease LAGLIDADG domain-containing protein n=1 Tax=marine sediment metagenome TaxID=412755 RepID=A0A0F9FQT1_9ZZZZ